MTQLPIVLPYLTALGRPDFLVSEGNREALGWLDRWPDWPTPALVLHGPAGCGKTHLAHLWAGRANAALIPGETIQAALPAAPAAGDPPHLAIDDAERADARALLHLHNLSLERGGTLLLIARRPPGEWDIRLADLRSRLRAAFAVGIAAPDEALLGAVLVKHFADRQLRVAPAVIAFLIARIERSFAAAAEIVERLDRMALADRRPVTIPLARRALAEFQAALPAEDGGVT